MERQYFLVGQKNNYEAFNPHFHDKGDITEGKEKETMERTK